MNGWHMNYSSSPVSAALPSTLVARHGSSCCSGGRRDGGEREGAGAGARARWQQGKLWLFFPPGLSSLLVILVAKEANQA